VTQPKTSTVNKSVWYVLAVAFLSSIIMGVVAIQYTNYVDRSSNQQWCDLVNVLDDAYRTSPPQTPIGKQLAATMAELKKRFEC